MFVIKAISFMFDVSVYDECRYIVDFNVNFLVIGA